MISILVSWKTKFGSNQAPGKYHYRLTRRYLVPGASWLQLFPGDLSWKSGFLLSSTSTINSHDELCQLSHVYLEHQCEQGQSTPCLLFDSSSRKPQATENNEIWIKVVNWTCMLEASRRRLFSDHSCLVLSCPTFLNCADLARFLLPHWEDIQDYIRELVLA